MDIHRLHYAQVSLSGQYNPPSFQDTRIDVFGYLIIDQAEVVLIDTGVGTDNDYVVEQFKPEFSSIPDQLNQYGIGSDDITTIVNTHLHFDHCGNNRLFTKARILIQQAEIEAASDKFYTVRRWFDYDDANIQEISGEHQINDKVRLLPTPGHTPGHQSVLIKDEEQTTLIAAQASFSSTEYLRGGDPEVQAHEGYETQYTDSIRRLKSLNADQVLFSHDHRSIGEHD